MSDQEESFFREPIPRARRFSLDAGYLGRRAHIIHGLLEIDVTKARILIREHQEKNGERLSFTAFIIDRFRTSCSAWVSGKPPPM